VKLYQIASKIEKITIKFSQNRHKRIDLKIALVKTQMLIKMPEDF